MMGAAGAFSESILLIWEERCTGDFLFGGIAVCCHLIVWKSVKLIASPRFRSYSVLSSCPQGLEASF